MPPKTVLKNQYLKYFEPEKTEWHRNIIGEYHVSAIGSNQQSLKQNKHSGPCLRNTFYGYIPVDKKEQSLTTRGTFKMGIMMHKVVQMGAKDNRPCIVEFPLARTFESGEDRITLFGSADLVEFDNIPEGGKVLYVTLVDLKSASDWTYPYQAESLNPTHRDQVVIYAYWLQNFVFNPKVMKISKIRVVYMNKQEAYCGEIDIPYDNDKAVGTWIDFISRAFELDTKLHRFMKIYNEWYLYHLDELKGLTKNPKLELELKMGMNNCLPTREPHHWCKFCDNRFRCRDNVVFDADVRKYSVEEIEVFYKNETGKNAIWRGKHTKAFDTYAYGFKLEGDEL